MATSLEAYESFLIKVNRNDVNSNIHIPKGKFVIIYNQEARKWLKEKLKRKLSTDELNELSDLLVPNIELTKQETKSNYVEYTKPVDFFNIASCTVLAKRGNCERFLDVWNPKSRDLPVLLNDSNNKPSFDYEETLMSISGKVNIYFDNFIIDKVYFSYYRFPKKIDIKGYINLNNEQSTDIDPEISDLAVDEIVNRCVLEVSRNMNNIENFQLSKDRVTTEE